MSLPFAFSLTGLLVLADFKMVAWRTVLAGTPKWHEALLICPGLHRQHEASNLANGEFPACAAMTTGYVFRVENPATVAYLQCISRTGQLTVLGVSDLSRGQNLGHTSRTPAELIINLALGLTISVLFMLAMSADWWATSFLAMLIFTRLVNTAIVRSQVQYDWHGDREQGEQGDLFILLSYDRWVRIKGDVESLKAVTSGRWMREATLLEDAAISTGTVLAHLSVVLAAMATPVGQMFILSTLIGNATLLGLANACTDDLNMKGTLLKIEDERRKYGRRKLLAEELIAESKRDDWAVAMALIPPNSTSTMCSQYVGAAVM